ncbi:hypothetical protein Hamer_G018034 [Homarus americanus]|uniref:Uncharacterized protein n=1 Tax=Homarus americanus TaxID=6706 RepID=A0A8J5KA13_HOMAM|nr:hypothetical protein Hamer_G018034 [Homarus americanus]
MARWIKSAAIGKLVELVNLMVLEEFKRKVPYQIMLHLTDKEESNLLKAAKTGSRDLGGNAALAAIPQNQDGELLTQLMNPEKLIEAQKTDPTLVKIHNEAVVEEIEKTPSLYYKDGILLRFYRSHNLSIDDTWAETHQVVLPMYNVNLTMLTYDQAKVVRLYPFTCPSRKQLNLLVLRENQGGDKGRLQIKDNLVLGVISHTEIEHLEKEELAGGIRDQLSIIQKLTSATALVGYPKNLPSTALLGWENIPVRPYERRSTRHWGRLEDLRCLASSFHLIAVSLRIPSPVAVALAGGCHYVVAGAAGLNAPLNLRTAVGASSVYHVLCRSSTHLHQGLVLERCQTTVLLTDSIEGRHHSGVEGIQVITV